MQKVLSSLSSIGLLEPALQAYLQSVLKTSYPKKGTILVKSGDTARTISFVEQGLIRGLRYKKSREMTTWIVKENDICISVRSFLRQRPADEIVEVLEDCTLHSITNEQLRHAYTMFPSFNFHRAEVLEKYYLFAELRESMRQQPAYDRFCFLMEYQGELIGRVKEKILASYLGVTPETYSSIKRKYAKNQQKGRRQ